MYYLVLDNIVLSNNSKVKAVNILCVGWLCIECTIECFGRDIGSLKRCVKFLKKIKGIL